MANRNQATVWQPARNWPLWIGLALLLLVALLAVFGPALAPRDPVKPVYIVQDLRSGEFVRPPFRPGQMPGFPLGADPLGRDTLSQLLWAIQPTLILVLAAAAVRLLLGLLIGVIAGWGNGRTARLLANLTTAAVSVPVLFVALCLVAALAPNLGVWAFVLGLCLTGWAETARMVQDQTSLIKTQPYVEAARALGGSDTGMVLKHVLPHVVPMAWIMLPLEISTALLVTAGLGFLGYFVNAIWIPLGDWTAIRTSGKPELGQMLASGATIVQRHPWLLLATGTVVFILILAFNLLGEGLRRQADPARARRRRGRAATAWQQVGDRVGAAIESRLTVGRGSVMAGVSLGALALLMLLSGAWLLRSSATPATPSAIAVPGGHLWSGNRHDAQGTFWATGIGPNAPQLLWQFSRDTRFNGGPAIAADGTLYLLTADSRVIALNRNGAALWSTKLPAPLFGAPVLNAAGDIYFLDSAATLYALTPQGDLAWALALENAGKPLASPTVDAAGVAYFATERNLVAVAPGGVLRWRTSLPTYSYVAPQPTLSADESLLFFEDIALSTATGQTVYDATDTILDRYVVGADGKLYLAAQDGVTRAEITADGLTLTPQATFDMLSLGLGVRYPTSSGVTPNGRIWAFYGTFFDYAKLLWTEADGTTLSVVDYPWSGPESHLLGIDEQGTAYICGNASRTARGGTLECGGYAVGRPKATWKLKVEQGGAVMGGAVADGRLYVLSNNELYAFGAGE